MSGPFANPMRTKQKKYPTIDVDVGLGNGSKIPKAGQQIGSPFQRLSTIRDVMHPNLSEGDCLELMVPMS